MEIGRRSGRRLSRRPQRYSPESSPERTKSLPVKPNKNKNYSNKVKDKEKSKDIEENRDKNQINRDRQIGKDVKYAKEHNELTKLSSEKNESELKRVGTEITSVNELSVTSNQHAQQVIELPEFFIILKLFFRNSNVACMFRLVALICLPPPMQCFTIFSQ